MTKWLTLSKNNEQELILLIRAKPRANKSCMLGESSDATTLEVAVAAPPVDGEANKELIEVISDFFSVRKKDVEVLSGETSRFKKILLRGISAEEVMLKVKNQDNPIRK